MNRRRRKRDLTPKILWRLLRETATEWQQDKASRLAAALSYYAIFSLAPLIIVVIAIAGSLFGEAAARGKIIDQIQGAVGPEAAAFLQTLLQNVNHGGPGTGIIASVLGIIALLFGATGLFVELQDALNTVWNVTAKPNLGLKDFIRKRLLSFAMILSVGFLLLLSLMVSAVLSALSHFAATATTLSGLAPFWQIVNTIISFGVITLLFATLYKLLPDVKIAWSDVWVGSGITSLLFMIGRYLLGLYLGSTAISSTYGAAGSLIILLVWFYYSAQILFFGAEFTQVYARQYGSQIVPNRYAVPLNDSHDGDAAPSKATDF
jgi:membrane protein